MNRLFDGLVITDHAKTAQNEIVSHLEQNGFTCSKEFKLTDRGDGRGGRIDIVATRGDVRLAIEVDKNAPRNKSIQKLQQMDGFLKIILLRGFGVTDCGDADVSVHILPVLGV